jgi:hypothetical protein
MNLIPLPAHVPGRLYATGFTDVGPAPDQALASLPADTLLCLLTDEDVDLRFPEFANWLVDNAGGPAWRFPIEDGGVADEAAMLALVDELVERLRGGERVVAHCGAGIGRTSLVCGLAVVALTGTSLDEALASVRAARPGAGPENPVQRAHLERLAARLAPPAELDLAD